MKYHRLVVYPGRKMVPRIPEWMLFGEPTQVLLFKVHEGKVLETQLFLAHPVPGGPCIHGFTHYAILPRYIRP